MRIGRGRAAIVGVLIVVGLSCLAAIGGERSGGAITFTAESINSGGIAFSTRGSISLGASVGQLAATRSLTTGASTLSPGFWRGPVCETGPLPTLFLFR